MTLFANKEVYQTLETCSVKTSIYEFKMNEIVRTFQNEASRLSLLEQFNQMSFRNFVTEFYENTKEYCKKTDQWKQMQEQPWFHYARLVRNCFSHNNRFNFNKMTRNARASGSPTSSHTSTGECLLPPD